MAHQDKPKFSIVTGASSGIGLELARIAAQNGSDLLIVSDGPEIETAAQDLRVIGVTVDAFQADLATPVASMRFTRSRGRPASRSMPFMPTPDAA